MRGGMRRFGEMTDKAISRIREKKKCPLEKGGAGGKQQTNDEGTIKVSKYQSRLRCFLLKLLEMCVSR